MLHNQDYHNILLSLVISKELIPHLISLKCVKKFKFSFYTFSVNVDYDVFLTNDIFCFLLAFSTN